MVCQICKLEQNSIRLEDEAGGNLMQSSLDSCCAHYPACTSLARQSACSVLPDGTSQLSTLASSHRQFVCLFAVVE